MSGNGKLSKDAVVDMKPPPAIARVWLDVDDDGSECFLRVVSWNHESWSQDSAR